MDGQPVAESVRVVYESEPRDHGVAAGALPAISMGFLRGVFAKLLRTSDDLNSFALDYFGAIHRQFSSEMTREAREDLLLAAVPPRTIYEALRASFGAKLPPPPLFTDGQTERPNPYRGLLAFGVKDAPLFFGRRKKTEELRRLFDTAVQAAPEAGVASPRLVAVIGPSGSGKSSLAQAGLLADLLRKPSVGISYVAAVLRPQGRPLRALARVLAKLRNPAKDWPLGEIDIIVEKLRTGPRALGDLVSDVLSEPDQRLLLVVDQLEELYSMADLSEAGMAERRAFVEAILDVASERRGRCDVVVTLRSDLLGEVGADPELQKAVTTTGRALLLGTLDADELAESVAGPAARAGRPLPPDAVALLVREAEGQAGALPLLQFTLTKLWKAVEDAPMRPIAELLNELGGVGGALAQEAESLYRALHPEPSKREPEPPPNAMQVRARRAFLRLLQARDGQVQGRRRQALADLIGDGESLADVRDVLDRFVASRLLVLDGEGAEAMVEIGHESLGRSWQRLARWISEAAAYLPVLLRLSEDARRWHKQGKPDRLLLRREELSELRLVLPMLKASGSLGAKEHDFAQASVTGVKLRQKRRADALVKERTGRAVSIARHVVEQVVTRLERLAGTAEIRKELLTASMRELDALLAESTVLDNVELLLLRADGYRRRGDVAMTHDGLIAAHREYDAARRLDEQIVARQPNNVQAQRDLSMSLLKLGEVAVQMGQFDEAKAWFQDSLKICEPLAQSDDKNAQDQGYLSLSLIRLGDVAVKMGQLSEAKAWFERSLSISERLVQTDVKDAQAQRDLSVCLEKLGDVAAKMGQLSVANAWFECSLNISERLAQADDKDAQAQRDLSISLSTLGDVAVQLGQFGVAKSRFARSLKISEQLAQADDRDAQAQRDLSVCLNKLGDVSVQMGQFDEAKSWFQDSLKLCERLAQSDPNDAQAQRDLSVGRERLGDVAVNLGQLREAQAWFERSLNISEQLAQADLHDPQAQRDLSICLEKLGTGTNSAWKCRSKKVVFIIFDAQLNWIFMFFCDGIL